VGPSDRRGFQAGGTGLPDGCSPVGNAVGRRGAGETRILLLGHIDTFPGDVPVRREGGLLYGRGTVDAKGPLAAFAAAASRIEVPEGWRVTVVGAVEEESASSKGARAVISQRARHAGPPFCCIVGEPSGWDRMATGYKGRLLADISLRAPFAHSAGPSPMPAERAVDLWLELRRACEAFDQESGARRAFDRLDASLRRMRTRDLGAHGEVDMGLAFRLPPALTPEQIETHLEDAVRSLSGEAEISVTTHGPERAYLGGKSNPLVRSLLAAIRAAGGSPRFVLKTGTCDMNVLGAAWPEVPMAAYGAGDSSLDHTPEERIEICEFLRSIGVLDFALLRIMGSRPGR
jgi:LysW-gamma-L-lysine carboxypeptidase